MTALENNIITHGLSGKKGKVLVFSQRNLYVLNPSKTNSEISQPQNLKREQFQQAIIYGNPKSSNKELLFGNSSGNLSFEVAIADMLQAPDIEKIDLSEYNGKAGDKITVTLTYELQVASVQVSIYNPDDSLAESGEALQSENEIDWIYTIQSANTLPGDKIVIKAFDLAGNLSKEEKVLF